jgi:phosphoribosylanthranilate isomerase
VTQVKICGLTNLEDARWACRCGANLLGFNFVPASPRYVTPESVVKITSGLATEDWPVRFVGVFANETMGVVHHVAETCSLDYVQLHGNETPDYAAALNLPFILARRVRGVPSWADLSSYDAWAYLFDAYDPCSLGGTGRTWQWDLLKDWPERPERIIVAGGLTPENVGAAIRQVKPWGVDVSSGVEASPGRKDPAKVERFIQRVREEDRA